MLGGAFINDDLAHLAVIEHMVDLVIARQQRLGAKAQFGVNLDRLRRGFLELQNAQAGLEAQAGEGEGLVTRGGAHAGGPLMRNTSTPTPSQSG